jgi:hypothetical protein
MKGARPRECGRVRETRSVMMTMRHDRYEVSVGKGGSSIAGGSHSNIILSSGLRGQAVRSPLAFFGILTGF